MSYSRLDGTMLDDIAAWIEGSRPRPAANERVSDRRP